MSGELEREQPGRSQTSEASEAPQGSGGGSRRARAWVDPVFGAALAGELLLLFSLNRFGDLPTPGNAVRFVPLILAAGFCYLLAVARFERLRPAWRPGLLWGAAVGLRVAVLFMPPGDDLWRYLWEGKLQLHGFNPYLFTPDAPALQGLREGWWTLMSHRGYAAIYPPGIEWIFARVMNAAGRHGVPPVFMPLLFKAVFAVADLGVVWLLLKLNTGSRRYLATAWYAWNPLVAVAFAGSGHYDSLMLLPLCASALLLHRANPLGACKPEWSWSILSAVLLGVAISIKTMPLLLLPVWAFALGRRSIVLGLSAAVPLGLALPFGGVGVVLGPFHAFADTARFNDLFWWAADRLVWPNPAHHNTHCTAVLLVTAAALAVFFRNDWRRGSLWVVGATLILSPVLQPWYLTWVLPFACWRKVPAWFVFSLTVLLAYLSWDNTVFGPAWGEPSLWLRGLMAGPPLLCLALTHFGGFRRCAAGWIMQLSKNRSHGAP